MKPCLKEGGRGAWHNASPKYATGLGARCGDRHRSLVTPERVLSEYNEDLLIF